MFGAAPATDSTEAFVLRRTCKSIEKLKKEVSFLNNKKVLCSEDVLQNLTEHHQKHVSPILPHSNFNFSFSQFSIFTSVQKHTAHETDSINILHKRHVFRN